MRVDKQSALGKMRTFGVVPKEKTKNDRSWRGLEFMKRIIMMMMMFVLCHFQIAFADNMTKIKINLTGGSKQNQYFLCIPYVGCLSVLAAQQGKTYSIYHPFKMENSLYVLNTQNFRLFNQGLPDSCYALVDLNKTLTISGDVINESGKVRIKDLKCSIA